MHYVSLIVEFLRGRPAVVFWTAALSQAALWVVVPSVFYSAPPGEVPVVLAVGHAFRLGSYLGPPLAFWLGEMAFRIAGIYGVYLLSQACVVLALWAVFTLGRAIVGTRHAVLAVLLMTGIAVYNVPSAEFGPAVLALPLWALALLHYWRAVGEDRRGYWFLLGLYLGLLLLTSYIGIVLVVLLVLFTLASERGWRALGHIEPWTAMLLLAIVVFPHAAWLRTSWPLVLNTILEEGLPNSLPLPAVWLAVTLLLTHAGVGLLVVLASGWRKRERERAPEIDRGPVEPAGRTYVYALALTPALAALALAFWFGRLGPLERVGPLVLLTSLAVIVAAGDRIYLYRENMVSTAWVGLLLLPPLLVALGTLLLPWTIAYELKVGQPAAAMGSFFADSFQRRTGKPLTVISGDPALSSLIALSAPTRPDVYFAGQPERSPWTSAAALRESGGILVWRAIDTGGAPPASLKAEFPELVPELPRAFERPVQGLLPLTRIGWAMLRPAVPPH